MLFQKRLRPFLSFIILLILSVLGRQYLAKVLQDQGIVDYTSHTLLSIGVNILIILISLWYIKKYKLTDLAGIGKGILQKKWLLLFPLYLVIINLLFLDPVPTDHLVWNVSALALLCLSIGFAEELSLRGFMQSYLITQYGTSKKKVIWSVIIAAFVFGLLHLLKFNKGLYGELAQVAFATFIGVMFGALLLLTKRLFPLAILHALIDFAAKLDGLGEDYTSGIQASSTLVGSAVIALIVLPCLIYGLRILKKGKLPLSIPD